MLPDPFSAVHEGSLKPWIYHLRQGLKRILKSKCKRQVQVADEMEETKGLPMLTGRQIDFMIFASFKINDVQGRGIDWR